MMYFRPGGIGVLASLMLIALSGPAKARVLSYGPLTGRTATPAVQKRTNRHALLIEQTGAPVFIAGPSCGFCYWPAPARLVLYDSSGLEEPRDVTPGGVDAGFDFAAAREDVGHPPNLLVHTGASLSAGENPTGQFRFLFSADGGVTWSVLPLPGC